LGRPYQVHAIPYHSARAVTPLTYEQSVTKFQPYAEIREPNPEATRAGSDLIERMLVKKRRGYIYVNNRLEGNAPKSLLTMLKGIRR
jgi:hypothetical protein